MRIRLFTPKECLKFWDECKPIRSGKLFWLSVRKCIECAVEQDEMLEKSHIFLDEFVGKFAGSKVFIDNGNHDEEIRDKTIDEVKQVINENLGGDAWVTIKQVLNNELDKLKGGSDED